ncbi:hypothetical protein JXA05_02500, partial [Candidatus Peregrinibacteria bacterium]|nr:hypothetical protein [Candidatus Peregrinibacteria bacterium]
LHKPSFQCVIGDVADSLALFPFNSFGNMGRPEEVIRSLALSRIPFLISSYSTDAFANSVRADYYKNCAYDGLKCDVNEKGVSFLSKDGLNTIAYHRDYLVNLFNEFGLKVAPVDFSPMGVAYKSV